MAWRELTSDSMLSALTQPERDLFGSGDSAGGDRLDEIVSWVVDQVRGKVSACPQNVNGMGPDGTIPAEVYGAAIDIARFKLLTSFPGGKAFLDEARVMAYRDALKHLDDAAACTIQIELAGETAYSGDQSGFGSRDDYLNNPAKPWNANVIDFGFWR